ncbi:hypothetical protein AURDEDRAFT_163044 [Auricularia subglabra TFB-10046 SS5]|nr:hypothetical protein AURDEDRAFT_163044 [Auricularia subglabra TFB-10046 SS5]
MWQNLAIVVDRAPVPDDSMQQDEGPPTNPEESRDFDSVIDSSKQSHRTRGWTSLKTAKEGVGVPQDAMDTGADAPVGDIGTLKVFSDPPRCHPRALAPRLVVFLVKSVVLH